MNGPRGGARRRLARQRYGIVAWAWPIVWLHSVEFPERRWLSTSIPPRGQGRGNSGHRVYQARVGYRFGFRRGFGQRVISLAGASLLWPALNIPSARAADGVVVACPELPEARAA